MTLHMVQQANNRGLPGQGVATPAVKYFADHAGVTKGNVLYDPSYGKKYNGASPAASLKAWEEASIFSFGTINIAVPRPRCRPNTDVADTRWKP